jgi:hypothetical protein
VERRLLLVHARQTFHTVNPTGYTAFENNSDSILAGIVVPGFGILLKEFLIGCPVFPDDYFVRYKTGFLI